MISAGYCSALQAPIGERVGWTQGIAMPININH